MRRLDGITSSVDMNLSKLWETEENGGAWRAAVHGLQRVGCNRADQQEPQQRTKRTLYPQGKDDWELRVGGIRRDLWQRFRKVSTPD